MQKEPFTIYQESCGAIMLKGSSLISRIPIALSYDQLQQLHYPVFHLPNFDFDAYYRFYSLSRKHQELALEQL